MKAFVGIDLGSTTTKAVVLDEASEVLGRGITNSRSNYKIACDVALSEALISARFGLLDRELEGAGVARDDRRTLLTELELGFRRHQYLGHLRVFGEVIRRLVDADLMARPLRATVDGIVGEMASEAKALFAAGASRKSDFFRDLAGSRYLHLAEEASRGGEGGSAAIAFGAPDRFPEVSEE